MTSQVRAHHGRRGDDGAEAQGLLELQDCQSVEALRICKAVVLMYIACAGRVGDTGNTSRNNVPNKTLLVGTFVCAVIGTMRSTYFVPNTVFRCS